MKTLASLSATVLMLLSFALQAQNIAITDDASYTADNSAMLDVKSTSKGLLIPRLTTSERNSISSPATGLMVYVTTDNTYYYYDGASWVSLLNSNSPPSAYAQVFTVAQSGGDFTTITAAMGACVAPGVNNRYLIRVMPGAYPENVVCKQYVRLQGAGKYTCHINGMVTAADSCTIEGFYIDGGIVCQNTSPTIMENIIGNKAGNGIDVFPPANPWIMQNEIADCEGWGIHCNGWDAYAWIIGNKIQGNSLGGIRCTNSSPTISNNMILENHHYGIYLIGAYGAPAEPTIDDNQIGLTDPDMNGVGIFMMGFCEPRIMSNDIYVNYTGIEIRPNTQPAVQANNINYNHGYGIRNYSNGASKPVAIKGNMIHSSTLIGLEVVNSSPIVTHNNINLNVTGVDVQYQGPAVPMISLNVFDTRVMIGGIPAAGLYNVTSAGLAIIP
ncbi:MAG: right-handed parallel beta-helix repeat-containing protein [Bacteroidales bacterium]|nr:right-handed parallel beta-helix repeat-containing protein [Bacteroidales bacterium]